MAFPINCYADDTQLYLSFQPDDLTVAALMPDRYFWLDEGLPPSTKPCKDRAIVVVPAKPTLHHNFTIQLGSSSIIPSRSAKNLGVVTDDQLNITYHIARTARSCRFALHNIRRIRPSLTEHATQLQAHTHIKFKSQMLAYRTTTGSAPFYLNSLLQTYVPSRNLRSASKCRLVVPSQRGTKSISLTFTMTVPCWSNDLPNSTRAAESI